MQHKNRQTTTRRRLQKYEKWGVDPHSAVKRKQDEKERREGQAKRKTSGMIHI